MYEKPTALLALQGETPQPYGFLWSTDVFVYDYGVVYSSGVGIAVTIYII